MPSTRQILRWLVLYTDLGQGVGIGSETGAEVTEFLL
jgi:hypothetical protein